MNTILFEGWEVGMKKISFYKMLKNDSHLTLKEAKSISDRILNNEVIKVTFETKEMAYKILTQSQDFGIKCKLINR